MTVSQVGKPRGAKVTSKSTCSKPKNSPPSRVLHHLHRDELLAAWTANPGLPTLASRKAWAKARNVEPQTVYKWFQYRVRNNTGKKQSYELPVGTPPVLPPRVSTRAAVKFEPVEEYLEMEALELKLEPNLIDNDSASRAPTDLSNFNTQQPQFTNSFQFAPIDYFADIPYSHNFDSFDNHGFSHGFDLVPSSSTLGPFLPPLQAAPPLIPAIPEPVSPSEVSLSIADKVKSRGRGRRAAPHDLPAVEPVQESVSQHLHIPPQNPAPTCNAVSHQPKPQFQAVQNVQPALVPHDLFQLQLQPPANIAPLPVAPPTEEVRIPRSLYINLVSIVLQYSPHSISGLSSNVF